MEQQSSSERPDQWSDGCLDLLPTSGALTALTSGGDLVNERLLPKRETMLTLFQHMVNGRRVNILADALAKQGILAVYPSSLGQEACQVAPIVALEPNDWLFPTYRDTVAVLTRGVPNKEAFSLFRGSWHCGYDPYKFRVAPQCTPLATHMPHAVGLAYAAKLKKSKEVALVLLGDGATSEGDAHEAFNMAAVWKVPVIFLIQNNGFAISTPSAAQYAAPSLAHRAIGYGIKGHLVDGNDAAALYTTIDLAVKRARAGGGPEIIEAKTYRIAPHTNADDPSLYREAAETREWELCDPLDRVRAYLNSGSSTRELAAQIESGAEKFADEVRSSINEATHSDPQLLQTHVLANTVLRPAST